MAGGVEAFKGTAGGPKTFAQIKPHSPHLSSKPYLKTPDSQSLGFRV